MDSKKLNHLLEAAWECTSKSKQLSLVRQILDIAPKNTEALILLADNTDDDYEREDILMEAKRSLEDPENYPQGMKDELFCAINSRHALTLFTRGSYSEALSVCDSVSQFLASNDDPNLEEYKNDFKSIFYISLIEIGQWKNILALTMKDDTHNLSWAYSRLIAAWMSSSGQQKSLCANMFWDALIISPDVPFYMLGYYEEPEDDNDNDDDEDEAFSFALMYYDILSVSEDFLHWFTRGTILFGLLTNRFDGKEREYVLDVLDSLGGYEEYERMSAIMLEADDRAVIETLAANKCLSD